MKTVDANIPFNTKPNVAIACGTYYTLTLIVDGRIFSFGRNNAYQLGDGTTTSRLAPIVVDLFNGFKDCFSNFWCYL